MTTLTGSACSRSLSHAASARAEWRAAHIDGDFQAEQLGADSGATARREARRREMEAAGVVLEALRAT